MLHHDGVEEDDVLVAEGGEEGVFGEGRRTLLDLIVGALALLVERVDLVAVGVGRKHRCVEGGEWDGGSIRRERGKEKRRTGEVQRDRKCHAPRE